MYINEDNSRGQRRDRRDRDRRERERVRDSKKKKDFLKCCRLHVSIVRFQIANKNSIYYVEVKMGTFKMQFNTTTCQ